VIKIASSEKHQSTTLTLPQSKNKAWVYVLVGGFLEIIWASGLKYDEIPVFLVIISLVVSFELIIKAAKVLPIGTAYAVFTGIGTIGTVVVEAVFSNGQMSIMKTVIILLLLLCIIVLKFTSKQEG
jgi:paired small multidrug resistance pump